MNKFRMTLLAAVAVLAFSGFTQQNAGIKFFEGAWDEVLKESARQNKPIFVDAYASWCGPCRWMANNIFPNPEVGEFYNANFINYKLDQEKGEGIQFRQSYRVTAYPTLLYMNSTGEVKHRILGGRAAEDFIAEGKKALEQLGKAD